MTTPLSNLSALERERIKRESKNSQKYRRLYTELLSERQSVLQKALSVEGTEESRLIETIKNSELKALAVGVLCGCSLFAAIRLGILPIIRRIGGEEKVRQLQKADEEAKRLGTYGYQRAFAWIMEGSFSIWLGNRAYQYQSKQSDGTYETVVKIPLCKGRSVVSDGICDEWVDIATNQIPKSFWKNLLEKDALHDERAWRAIAGLSNNCVKRRAFERTIEGATNEKNLDDNDAVLAPLPTAVPEDLELSASDIEKLVEDCPSR